MAQPGPSLHSPFCVLSSGPKFVMEIKNALLGILLQTPIKVLEQVNNLTVSFYMPVHNPVAWPALLHCLEHSDFKVSSQAARRA